MGRPHRLHLEHVWESRVGDAAETQRWPMTESDPYFLSCRLAELTRLQDQAQQLGDEARWLFDQLDLESGARVVEIGCGPLGYLDLLAEHVGPAGTVVGLERSVEAVALARQCASEHYLEHIEVLHYFQAW